MASPDFSAYNSSGVSIYYRIVGDRAVEVTGKDDYGNRTYTASTVNIPNSVTVLNVTYAVIGIGEQAFINSTCKKISLPDFVEYIGDGAFENCESLTEIENFPTSLTSISNRMFYGCESLEEFDIPEGVTTIGDYAFFSCYGLKEGLTIPEGVTTIGDYAFYNSRVNGFTLTSALTSIGQGAFGYCSGLPSELTVPNTIKLGGGAFGGANLDLLYFYIEDCQVDGSAGNMFGTELGTVIFGDDVRTIPGGMFASCKSVDEVVYGDKITSVGNYAFAHADLPSVPLPNTVTSIGDHAFAGCSIENITLPNSVTSIGDHGFYACSSKRITIPNGVTAIEESMFESSTDLLTVILGDAVETIGDYAFWYCINLKELFSPNPTPPVCGKGVFDYINSGCVLYVPAESIEAYASAEGWKDFFDIRDMATNGIEAVAEDNVDNSITEIYTISGQRVDVAPKGVNIVRYADGTTKKIINK